MTKTELLKKLEESRSKFLETMGNNDVNKIIYAEGGWRARDIMLNVAYWEHEAAKSLNAYRDGGEYFVENLTERINIINEETFQHFKDKDYSEILKFYEDGRKKLIDALNKFSDEELNKEHTAFYGGRSQINDLILFLIDHEQVHLADIVETNQA